MKNKVFIIFAIVAGHGCGLVKKENLKAKTTHQSNLSYSSNTERIMQQQELIKDSSNSVYEIELWPKGRVIFSKMGFEGEATKVLIKGKDAKHLTRTVDQRSLTTNGVTVKSNEVLIEKKRMVQKQKRQNVISIMRIILVVLVLMAIVYVFWKRKKLIC